MRPIDMHVHIVGNGSSGSGCRLSTRGLQWLLAQFMVRHIGLPPSALSGDLDRLYVQHLRRLVRQSSLGAAVILAHEDVYAESGRRLSKHDSVHVPNDYVLRLARECPEFLAGVSIHPARHDALDELERCAEAGAVLLKLLPNCQNVDCNNRRYRRFWERMAKLGLPLLAHTGGEHTVPQVRPELADPRTLRLPLDCGVAVIAAHAATKSGIADPQYFGVLVRMMGRYPRLYTDNSAFNTPLRGSVTNECLRSPVAERIVHGSDFPVPVMGTWAWMRGLIDGGTRRRLDRIPNVIERDYRLKQAVGFGPETFTRVAGLLRLTSEQRRRLE